MLSDILVTSNFPDVLSKNVEYTISLQLLMDERREGKIRYVFDDEDALKRLSHREVEGTFFYDDLSLSFTLSKIGVYTFKVFFGHHQIYEKRFIVEDVLEEDYYIHEKYNPVCFQRPENISYSNDGNTFIFECEDMNYTRWMEYYYDCDIKRNDKAYCGIRYFAPSRSTHWRIITKGSGGTQDSGFVEFTTSDGDMVDWYFPIAKIGRDVSVLENTYTQKVGFYLQFGCEYVELDYEEYSINITTKNQKLLNNNIWNEEVLRLIYFIREGYQTKDLIKKYGAWHSLSDEEVLADIRKYKDNFGEFALHRGLIETENQAILLNYATHYTLIDSIIKLGITDLKQTREDFQDLMLKAKKGISEVLPQIK